MKQWRVRLQACSGTGLPPPSQKQSYRCSGPCVLREQKRTCPSPAEVNSIFTTDIPPPTRSLPQYLFFHPHSSEGLASSVGQGQVNTSATGKGGHPDICVERTVGYADANTTAWYTPKSLQRQQTGQSGIPVPPLCVQKGQVSEGTFSCWEGS